jgi:Protein of unknown function (DUF5661)/ADP-Ribosyltransferase in polyvalent proteins
MAKERLTENIAEQTPAGGVLVGKRNGQTMIHNKGSLSGYLVGKTHAEGGIEAVNKATGQPLEMQGGEVVITAPAVSDQTKREFEGKMMTNREILSEINSRGGGVSFAKGGDIPAKLKYTGASYNYGGKTMSDHDIYMHINGGHLAKGKTLKQIAKMHDVNLLDIEKQVKIGMKAESEHTSSKREQLKIVKDHLFENPKYYTLLKKAGLKKGGSVSKINLVKSSEKGDTPARDLNNYNDLLDVEADGAVGGDNGLEMAKGGALSELDKHFDLGGDISMPAVQLIKIKRVDNGAYYDLKGLEFRSFIDFADVVKDSFLDNSKAPVAIIFTVNDDAKEMGILCKNAKNTVLNFNPITGTVKDFEKQIQRRYPRSAKNFYWENWLQSKVLPKTSATASNSKMLVSGFQIGFINPKTNKEEEIKSDTISELVAEIITQAITYELDNVDISLIVDGFVLRSTMELLSVSSGATNGIKEFNLYKTTKSEMYDKLVLLYPDFDFSKVKNSISAQSTALQTPKITDLTYTKIEIGDNPELSKAVQEKAFELGWHWENNPTTVQKTNAKYLHFWSDKTILAHSDQATFEQSAQTLIKASDLLDSAPTTSSSTPTANNVIDPVFSTEVPDSIPDFSGIAKDLPPAVLILAFKRAYEQGVEPKDVDVNSNISALFSFDKTAEGFDFWADIFGGIFIKFKEKYGKYGEKLKDAVLGLKKPIQSPKITDLTNTKIWIGDNPELSRAVQEKAFELGWEWIKGGKTVRYTDTVYLTFTNDKSIFFGENDIAFGASEKKEIFASDLLDSSPTTSGQQSVAQPQKADVPLTPEQELAKKFVADDFQLRKNDLLGNSLKLEEARKDLEALSKLLPSFQASKFAVEKASILKEMARLNKKITYEGFIRSNEEASKGDDLFTPQGLLDYYYTQTTQNPTAELEPACELPTPNGAKSKLPMGAYLNVRTPQFKKWFGDWEKAYETGNYVNCSKMIDEETKEPKIYFHGVRKYVPNFGQMSNMGVGVVRPYGSFEPPSFPASYFADNESYANFYGGIAENLPTPSPDYKPFIYKVFLSVKNPISLLPLDFELSYKDLVDYIFVAYGIRLKVNNALLSQLDNDIDKKHPIWIYIRRDIGLIETLKEYGYDALFQTGDIPVFDKNGEVVSDRSKFIKDAEYLTFYPNQVKSATVKKSFYFDFFNDIRFKKGGYVRI